MKDVRRVAVFMHQNTFLIWHVMMSGVELYQRLLFVSHASFKESMPAPVLVLITCWMEVEKCILGSTLFACFRHAFACIHWIPFVSA
jgi:hypothetical protein